VTFCSANCGKVSITKWSTDACLRSVTLDCKTARRDFGEECLWIDEPDNAARRQRCQRISA
jgi:hypothetical protein